MNLTKSERFRLSTRTFGVRFEDGKPASNVLIPHDSVIEIVSGFETPQKMIEVDWNGLRVMVFVQHVRAHGELVDPVAKCVYCGAETELYMNGSPICISCDDKPKHERPIPQPKPPLQRTAPEGEHKNSPPKGNTIDY